MTISQQLYNAATVFDLSLKKSGGLPRGPVTREIGFEASDVFRYLTGLARYKTTPFDVGGVKIGNIASILEDDSRVTIDDVNNSIQFEQEFQVEYRIPFWKIEFIGDPVVQKVGAPDFGPDERSLFYESFQDIRYYFRGIDWVKIFLSPEVFNEFLDTGELGGPLYTSEEAALASDGHGGRRSGGAVERLTMEACERTIQMLMDPRGEEDPTSGPIRFMRRARSMTYPPSSPAPVSLSYTDLSINTTIQAESNIAIDGNYNFLSREFEFGPLAPANRFYTGFEESLMPSSYLFSVIKNFENLLDSLLRRPDDPESSTEETALLYRLLYHINALKDELFFGEFKLEPYTNDGMSYKTSPTTELYNKFGVSVKNLTGEQFDTAYGEEGDQQKRRLILIDPAILKENNFQSLFPFNNRIEITDIAGVDYREVTRNSLLRILDEYSLKTDIILNLMDGVVTPADGIITSNAKSLSIITNSSERPTPITSTRSVREFDFKEVFNNSSQPFVFHPGVPFLDPRDASTSYPTQEDIITQLGEISQKFTTPYLSGVNLGGYLENNLSFIEGIEAFVDIQDTIRSLSEDAIPSLKEMFLSERGNYHEVLAYRVIKENISTGATQQFFISNGPEGITEFFDTQVKPNQEYNYTLSALMFVIQNSYRYQLANPLGFEYNVQVDRRSKTPPYNNGLNDFFLGARIRIRQQPKIIEVPLTSENSVLTDAPPVRPNVDFYPMKGFNDRVKIRVSSMNSTEHAMPVIIEEGDRTLFRKIMLSQEVTSGGKIRFHSDETPAAFEVFRLDRKPETIKDFVAGKRVIRSVTSEDLSTDGTSFMDSIIPNTDYYYLFRTLDFHGNISNPTEVFKFTIIDNDGALQPLLTTLSLKEMFGSLKIDGLFLKTKKGGSSKSVRRFIKIRPSTQEISFIPGQFNEKTSAQISSVELGRDGLKTRNNIIDQRYMLELKSKKTGKSIFVEFKYTLNDFNIATEERRTMVPDTVTEQDIQDALARRNEGDVSRRGEDEFTPPSLPGFPAFTPEDLGAIGRLADARARFEEGDSLTGTYSGTEDE